MHDCVTFLFKKNYDANQLFIVSFQINSRTASTPLQDLKMGDKTGQTGLTKTKKLL
jgi:hypothetical protein